MSFFAMQEFNFLAASNEAPRVLWVICERPAPLSVPAPKS
jgi:hypothetical protein